MKKVELGKTGLRVSELSFGTGTKGWAGSSEQTRIGYKNLVDLIKFAYERDITFWDSADQYGSHKHFAEVLKGVDRSSVTIATKMTSHNFDDAEKDIKRFLKELGTDYLDIVLLHCATGSNWAERSSGAMEALSEAKEEGLIRAVGISCHDFDALKAVADNSWLDVILVRINPYGARMDASPEKVVPVLEKIHATGKGVYAMKVFGQGSLVESKRECMKYVLDLDCVDAMTIGMKSQAQVLENLSLFEELKGERANGLKG